MNRQPGWNNYKDEGRNGSYYQQNPMPQGQINPSTQTSSGFHQQRHDVDVDKQGQGFAVQSTGAQMGTNWGGQQSMGASNWSQPGAAQEQTNSAGNSWSGQNFGNSSFSPSFDQMANIASNPVIAGMAMQEMNKIASNVVPGASSLWNNLRTYMHVDNRFVLNKIRLLLFPWLHKDWSRIRVSDEGDHATARGLDFAPPVADVNAPDLYLPCMAFVTYALCIGFLKGSKGNLNPEVLLDSFSTSIFTIALEVLFMKGSLYIVGFANVYMPWLDTAMMSGYKFVGLALSLVIGICLGDTLYNICVVYCTLAVVFFIYRTMAMMIPQPEHHESGHKRRVYFLGICVTLQVLSMLFLGFNRDMGTSVIIGQVPSDSHTTVT